MSICRTASRAKTDSKTIWSATTVHICIWYNYYLHFINRRQVCLCTVHHVDVRGATCAHTLMNHYIVFTKFCEWAAHSYTRLRWPIQTESSCTLLLRRWRRHSHVSKHIMPTGLTLKNKYIFEPQTIEIEINTFQIMWIVRVRHMFLRLFTSNLRIVDVVAHHLSIPFRIQFVHRFERIAIV